MGVNIDELNGPTLAYLGDAVLELMVRELLICDGSGNVGKYNRDAAKYVKATSQSAAFEKISDILSEDEEYAYKHGRNAHGISAPKSASTVDYRRATGFEALFGYLYLSGKKDRMYELFRIAFSEEGKVNE